MSCCPRYTRLVPFFALLAILSHSLVTTAQDAPSTPVAPDDAAQELKFLSSVRQLTFEGRRAGEGYFSRDGKQLVFQSERDPANPFFQIFLMDMETGDTERVSPGTGKTTCAWIHPKGDRVLYASTHEDLEAAAKQVAELEARESGTTRRYAWDYDPTFELYEWSKETKTARRLTDALGYDAEASWSPDGSQIVFASNRQAYERSLTEAEQKQLELDPSYFIDLYIMNADGSNIRRLTQAPGYDGGPFFSADGRQICWRHFSEDGATAEIMVMNADGTEPRQVTRFGAMSWAPYFHPSGDYLIFTTNVHGFANFELYLADLRTDTPPVRVTYTDGFDGLPVFTPDGNGLCWTSNRTRDNRSQLFLAKWNHDFASQMLRDAGSSSEVTEAIALDAREQALAAANQRDSGFTAVDVMRHVDYLCRSELGGRETGTPGERAATAYVAAYLESLGLTPLTSEGWFQAFDFTSGVSLGEGNRLVAGDREYRTDVDWRPIGFSSSGAAAPGDVVFAGYGIVAPAENGQEEYDSFVHLDVADKWVVVFRFLPEDIPAERRQHLSTRSSLRYKAMTLRDRGARGMIVVSGPTAVVREELIPLGRDGNASATSLPIVSVTNEVAAGWLASVDKDLKQLQETLDTGALSMGFPIEGLQIEAAIDIRQEKSNGRNVLGRLQVGQTPSSEVVVIGAHIDHLGLGGDGGSLARDDERGGIHYGADDNASGIAGMLEIAEHVAEQVKSGKWPGNRDLIFAAWSGEELGLLGSTHFLKLHQDAEIAAAHGVSDVTPPTIVACLNMDMIGRLREKLVLQGTGSSAFWAGEIERRNAPVGLNLTLQADGNLPTDAAVFYRGGIPILSAFTGSHEEYHTPRDTPETLNPEGAAQVARLMAGIARGLSQAETTPEYIAGTEEPRQARAALRAYLGTVPDYAQEGVQGVLLSSVAKNGPAAASGVKGGDVIVELAGRKIENIYDYTFAIEALKIGEKVKIVVKRGEERIELEVTPGSRD